MHKSLFAHCVDQAIDIGNNELGTLCDAARDASIRVMTGCIERDRSRGQSVFAPLVTVDDQGAIRNVHRKIMPIYEERLVWSPGDGAGLKTYEFGRFRLGGLNCWENWMPLAHSALYAHGEDLHVASWPGSARNTEQFTPFIAREARSFVLSASSLMRREDIPDRIPHAELLRAHLADVCADGGGCSAGPDAEWIVAPRVDEEVLLLADLDHTGIREARQNFDPFGHYSRPDVLEWRVDRQRPSGATFIGEGHGE